MKLRSPESVEDAMTQAVALLGPDVIAMALTTPFRTVSESMVRKWGDPDADKRISFVDARAIDRLLRKTGHAAVFHALLELDQPVAPDTPGEPVDPLQAGIRMVVDASALMDQVDRALADGRLDGQEIVTLRAATQRLQKRLARFIRALVLRPAVRAKGA